ncbi:MAG TPA: hypothetical protein VEU33_41960 [Archangium sp.]|nr:hypothetical protein [Archangium sp.]
MTRILSSNTAKIRVDGTGEIVEVEEEGGGGARREHWADCALDGVVATWAVFEYPPGVIEDVNCEVDGGELVQNVALSLEP